MVLRDEVRRFVDAGPLPPEDDDELAEAQVVAAQAATGRTVDASPPSRAVIALSRELASYSERIARALECPEGEVWALYLAATGRMLYPGQRETEVPFPDGDLPRSTRTRYELWGAALREVLEILGPVEARLRTGYDVDELRSAVDVVVGEGPARDDSRAPGARVRDR